jgi:hypothetical protein
LTKALYNRARVNIALPQKLYQSVAGLQEAGRFGNFVYNCPLRRTEMNKSFVIASLIAAAALAACGKKEEPAPAPAPAPVEAPAAVTPAEPAPAPAAAPASEAAPAADAAKQAADQAATAATAAASEAK